MTDAIAHFNISDALGSTYDTRRTKVWVTFNTENGRITDENGNVRTDAGAATVATNGDVEVDGIPVPSAATNPISFQVKVHYETADVTLGQSRRVDKIRGDFGWMTITGTTRTVTNKALTSNVATITVSEEHGLLVGHTVTVASVDATFNGTHTLTAVTDTTLSYAVTAANVASVAATGTLTSPHVALTLLEEEQAVPAEYLTTVTAELDTYVTNAETAETNAEAAQAAAEAARDDAVDISNISTSDGVVEALVLNTGGAGPLTSAALAATFVPRWKATTAYTAGQAVINPSGRLMVATTSHTSGASYSETNWTGPRLRTGERGFPAEDPSGYTKLSSYHDAAAGMVIWTQKVAGDSTDVNVDGAIIVKHGKDYAASAGYADTLQVYTLAGSEGTIIGNNSYEGDGGTPYSPPVAAEDIHPDGWVRFELGPRWPQSEKGRFNNEGDFIIGWPYPSTSLGNCTQTGDVVTTTGLVYSSDVGKFIRWQGKHANCDRIVEFLTDHTVRVETEREIPVAEEAWKSLPKTIITTDGVVQNRTGLKIRPFQDASNYPSGRFMEWQTNDGLGVFGSVNTSGVLWFENAQFGLGNRFRFDDYQFGLKTGAQTFDSVADVQFNAQHAAEKALVLKAFAAGSTAPVLETQKSDGTAAFSISPGGLPSWRLAANEQTTVGAAGAASALPATPTKYLKVIDSAGTTLVIPAYAAS